MPARVFRVILGNATNFALNRIGPAGDPDQGRWTDGWPPPPASVAPGTAVAWQSESGEGSFMTGTEGRVTYEIQDKAAFLNGHNGRQERIFIHWDNPWFGKTQDGGTHFYVRTFGPVASDPAFPNFTTIEPIDDYHEGTSDDYDLVDSGGRAQGSDGGVDTPGPIDTSGWLELMPGWNIVSPIPDPGHIDHAWVGIAVQFKPGIKVLSLSLKRFLLLSGFDPSKGLRNVRPGNSVISMRSLLQS
jgi:hypothetical protein